MTHSKNNMTKYILTGLAITSFAGTAYAQDNGAYGVIGTTSYKSDVWTLDAKLGYNFNKNFAVEVQGGFGVSSEDKPVTSAPGAATLTTKVDYSLGAFAVARVPLNEQFEIFARGGVHNTQVNYKLNNALASDFNDTDTGLAGGAGIQFKISPTSALRAEYTYYGKTDRDTLSLGYVRKF